MLTEWYCKSSWNGTTMVINEMSPITIGNNLIVMHKTFFIDFFEFDFYKKIYDKTASLVSLAKECWLSTNFEMLTHENSYFTLESTKLSL